MRVGISVADVPSVARTHMRKGIDNMIDIDFVPDMPDRRMPSAQRPQ